MKKTSFLFLIVAICFLNIHLHAQDIEFCGTAPIYADKDTANIPWYGNNSLLYELLDEHSEYLIDNRSEEQRRGVGCYDIESPLAIPVKFWVWGESETNFVANERHLQNLIDAANDVFYNNNLNWRLYMYCPEFVVNPDFLVIEDDFEVLDLNDNGRSDDNAINVHLVQNGVGWRGIYVGWGDYIALDAGAFNNPNFIGETFPHELGHYLGLDHPFVHTEDLFQDGEACCLTEPVTRGKVWNDICIGCAWVGIPFYRKTCDKRGDFLCDTPADPRGAFNNINAAVDPCTYQDDLQDGYGDLYAPNVDNIMSGYGTCRTKFTSMQKGVMFDDIFGIQGRSFIYGTDQAITDPDAYEPDNTDFLEVPRLIAVGETQCHSMHEIYENEACNDVVDWLRIENENGLIGSYRIVVRDVPERDNPVEDVIIHNTNNAGLRTSEVSITFTDNGTERIWEIPCGEMVENSNTTDPFDYNDFLVEIVRGDRGSGYYEVSLETDVSLPNVKSKEQICVGETFNVVGLPEGATVIWNANNITIDNTTGSSTTVTSTGINPPYRLTAIVSHSDCSYRINREFSELGGDQLPGIGELAIQVSGEGSCEPNFTFTIPPVLGATYYEWQCSANPLAPPSSFTGCLGGNSTTNHAVAYIETGTPITIHITVTASNQCGASVSRSWDIPYQPDSDCDVHLTDGGDNDRSLVVSPNPVNATEITLEIIDNLVEPTPYQIMILSQYGELKYINESAEKIHQINILDFVNGLYYAEVVTNSGVTTTSFIVQN